MVPARGSRTARLRRLGRAKRGVTPIVASILLIAVVIVLAAILYVLVTTVTHNVAATPPLAAHLLLAPPSEGTAGTGHWYNFSIEVASGGLVYRDLGFQLLDPTGSIGHLPTGSSLTVLDFQGHPIASYNWSTSAWPSGGSAAALNQQVVSVYTGASSFSGGRLIVAGLSGFTGSVATTIP